MARTLEIAGYFVTEPMVFTWTDTGVKYTLNVLAGPFWSLGRAEAESAQYEGSVVKKLSLTGQEV
jgi:hypothetical protein